MTADVDSDPAAEPTPVGTLEPTPDDPQPASAPVVTDPAGAAPPARRRRRFDPKLALASLAIAFGLVLIGFGVLRGVTGDDVLELPAAIEAIDPRPDAVQVPSQTDVVVDLTDGYTGELLIDGVFYETHDRSLAAMPEPGQQVELPPGVLFDPGTNTLSFVPSEETGFDEFAVGNHDVTVYYWKIVDGRVNVRSYSWTFNVV